MQSTPPEEYLEIAEKVRTGEYFREARSMYDLSVHDPMAERYFYIAITALSAVIFLIAFVAMQGLYPLTATVPFIVSTNNIVEDLPHIRSLLDYKGENPSEALLHFMVNNYVTFREDYDINTFDRNVSGVRSQSTQQAFNEFQQAIDPSNPESPITLYQRLATRNIKILLCKRISSGQDSGLDGTMEVTYEASVNRGGDIKKSLWQAKVAFQYNGITLDEATDKVKPIHFIVTSYHTTRLQDEK